MLTAEEADQRNIDQLAEETFSLSESEKKIETENEATEKALEKEHTELQKETLPVSQEERSEDVEGKSRTTKIRQKIFPTRCLYPIWKLMTKKSSVN